MQELAARMGVRAGYLSQISTGRRPWTPKMREKAAVVLGEVPWQGIVYRQGGVVTGESSYIRERARALGMTMRDLADRVGESYGSLNMTGGPRPREHGREGAGADRVGAGGSGEDCAGAARRCVGAGRGFLAGNRLPPGRARGEQLHPGARS